MPTPPENRAFARRRHQARLALLKKRTAIASMLGFAALLGLVTQHAVKGGSGATTAQHASRTATRATSTTSFFDAQDTGFAFDDGSGSIQSSPTTTTSSPPPPVAQSSVS